MYQISKSINKLTCTSQRLQYRGISTLSRSSLNGSAKTTGFYNLISKNEIVNTSVDKSSNSNSSSSNIYRHFSSKTGGNIQSSSFSKTPMGVFADQLFLQPIDPSNTRPITDLRIDTKTTLQQKFERAYLFKDQWKNTPLAEKKAMLSRFRDLLVARMDKLARDMTEETGKPISQAKNEVKASVDRVNFFLHNVESTTQSRVVRETDKFQEVLTYEPQGVIANISAWNYPYFVGLNVIIPALLTGNCVLYKPSEYSSITGLNIMALLYEAGVPEEAFQIVLGKSIIAQSLLSLPIDGVYFTGSYKTGKAITETLAGRMVKTQLELGGKCAAYVHKSADLASAVASIADGAMYNTGQSCCSVERVYVDKEIYERFLKELVLAVKSFRFSFDPTNPKTYFGPLTRGVPQIEHLQRLIGSALKRGAVLELGGNVVDEAPGYFFAPTIISNVHHGMEIQREELFGPVVTVQIVSGQEEAAALMNDTPYGLAGSVYSSDINAANYIIDKCNAGSVYWNACDRVSPYLPWTGRNHSGIGSTLGIDGIHSFVRPKALHLVGPKNPAYQKAAAALASIVPTNLPSADQLMEQFKVNPDLYAQSPLNEMEHPQPALPSGITVNPIDPGFPVDYEESEDRELLSENDEDTNSLLDSEDFDEEEQKYIEEEEGKLFADEDSTLSLSEDSDEITELENDLTEDSDTPIENTQDFKLTDYISEKDLKKK